MVHSEKVLKASLLMGVLRVYESTKHEHFLTQLGVTAQCAVREQKGKSRDNEQNAEFI